MMVFQRALGAFVSLLCLSQPVHSRLGSQGTTISLPHEQSARWLGALTEYAKPFDFLLAECEGDCDDDNDCDGGLICWERGPGEIVPGCDDGENDHSETDYCVDPNKLETKQLTLPQTSQTPSPTPTTSMPTGTPGELKFIPGFAPDHTMPLLGLCQGDCDEDRDCAEGLVCFQRDAGDIIPGCIGGEHDNSRTDYCVNKEETLTPTAHPSETPTNTPSTSPTQVPSVSSEPTHSPSSFPSEIPSHSSAPSQLPSRRPSSSPSLMPTTEQPTNKLSTSPTQVPSVSSEPTHSPSSFPSEIPSHSSTPSQLPSRRPSSSPSLMPTTEQPTNKLSTSPTQVPSVSSEPTHSPSSFPSEIPSHSSAPSQLPTLRPSSSPSLMPVRAPGYRHIIPGFAPGITKPLLGLCQGDCDKDRDCAEGLVCFQRNGGDAIPGCIGGEHDNSRTDYCTFPVPSSQPSTVPSDQPSMVPSEKPSIQPSPSPSAIPSDLPSMTPSEEPSLSLAPSQSPSLSAQPSGMPTFSLDPSILPSTSSAPSSQPSTVPSAQPSMVPSEKPSIQPSPSPSAIPSDLPSMTPSEEPSLSLAPSQSPSLSAQPSGMPTLSLGPSILPSTTSAPSSPPSTVPSDQPSMVPSEKPSISPSVEPSPSPSAIPSGHPSMTPSEEPSLSPSEVPSQAPSLSFEPSQQPSQMPSQTPTSMPTGTPGELKLTPDFVPGSTAPLLGLCEGDCDFDIDCAEGLYCFQRDANDVIPGCIGGEYDNSRSDYCTYKYPTATIETSTSPPARAPTADYFRLKMSTGAGGQAEAGSCLKCKNGCVSGSPLQIMACENNDVAHFNFVGIQTDEMLIQVVDSDLCLQRFTGQDITLRTCDQNSMQIWSETASALDALSQFRLSMDISDSTTYCLTHPASGGDARLELCSVAIDQDTSLWTKY